jgi:hypothetical protein
MKLTSLMLKSFFEPFQEVELSYNYTHTNTNKKFINLSLQFDMGVNKERCSKLLISLLVSLRMSEWFCGCNQMWAWIFMCHARIFSCMHTCLYCVPAYSVTSQLQVRPQAVLSGTLRTPGSFWIGNTSKRWKMSPKWQGIRSVCHLDSRKTLTGKTISSPAAIIAIRCLSWLRYGGGGVGLLMKLTTPASRYGSLPVRLLQIKRSLPGDKDNLSRWGLDELGDPGHHPQ